MSPEMVGVAVQAVGPIVKPEPRRVKVPGVVTEPMVLILEAPPPMVLTELAPPPIVLVSEAPEPKVLVREAPVPMVELPEEVSVVAVVAPVDEVVAVKVFPATTVVSPFKETAPVPVENVPVPV